MGAYSDYLVQNLPLYLEGVSFVLVGAIGGLVYLVLLSKKLSVSAVIRNMVIGAFCGFVAGDACAYVDIPAKAALAAAGIAGFCGGFGILLLVSGVAKRLGVNPADVRADLTALQGCEATANPITILENWLNNGVISSTVFGRMAGGHLTELNTLLEYGKIPAEEYETVRRWIIKRKQDTEIPEASPIVPPVKRNRKVLLDEGDLQNVAND